MAAGSTAREFHTQQIHYLRKSVTFADNGTAVTVGVLPAGAQIVKPISGAAVNVAFNAGTTNVIDIGTSADPDFFATNLAAGSIAFVPIDEAVTNLVAADTTITATVELAGTAATAGAAEILIAYIPDNDG